MLYLLPDQALLVFQPQRDGNWLIKRISAWDTGSPREESLAFAGQSFNEGATGYEDLKVDPASHYAVIRVKSIYSIVQDNSAVVVLIDLRNFTIVSRLTTTDPLLAASYWSFSKNGLLVATAMTGRVMTPPHPKPEWSYQTITDSYEATAFTLPDWQPSMSCKYELLLDRRAGSTNLNFHLSKADDGCAGLVASAGFPPHSSYPEVYSHQASTQGLPGQRVNWPMKAHMLTSLFMAAVPVTTTSTVRSLLQTLEILPFYVFQTAKLSLQFRCPTTRSRIRPFWQAQVATLGCCSCATV